MMSRVASVGGAEYFDRITDQELKTEDPKQQGTESAGLTGRENLPPANHRRWVPPTLRPQYGLTEEAKNDAIFRKVRGILNKLTPEKFEKLSNDLLKLDLNSPIILKGVIFLIFEKALDEPKYSSMYAQLCKRLSKEAPNFEPSEKCCTFLRLLLNVCRDKFENRIQYSRKLINSSYVLTDDDDEKKSIAKQKILGNIKFIGELFKLDMLDKGHLHHMLKHLTEKRPSATIEEKCEDMECFAHLLKTCGKNLEDDESRQLMDQYFQLLTHKSQSLKYPPRIRFLLRDVIELRKNKWIPRNINRTEGPVPIQELTNDDELLRPTYNNRNRDNRNQNRESDHWMNKLPLNLQPGYNDMFNSLSVSSPTQLINQPYSSSSNNYNNRDMRDNGSGNNYRHNSRNQNQHNSYNNTRYNNKNANQNMSMHNSAYSNIMNKDLAPRFKRNLMTSSQAPVEELQMRPTANSLLYKTQSISVSKISFNNGNPQQNQPHSNNRKITNGQPNDSPTYYGGGGSNVNDGNYNNQQHSLQLGHSSPITATGNTNNNSNNNMPPIQQQQQQLQNFVSDTGTPSLAQKSNTPINNILNKDQVAIKHSAATDKATKQKNKDKGPSKDDVLKTVSIFISDFLLMDNAQKSTLKISTGTGDQQSEQDPAPYAQILVEAFVQLNVPDKFMKDAIVKILNETLDKTADVHDSVIDFLLQLRKSNQKLTNHITLESFKSLINGMNEKEKSIPKVTTLVSLLLTKAVTVKLCKLADIANYSENGQHYPLLLLILQQLNKTLGKQALIELFNASRINLLATLPESDRTKDRMAEILEDRQLSFLYPLLRVQSELWKQLQFDPHPQQFYKWIKENIDPVCYNDPSFITALMTVLVKYVTQESTLADGTDKTKVPDKATIEKEKNLLQKFCPILINYLNGNVDLQMTAIYALQVFCYGADFPKGMLLRWFTALYELNVIEEDSLFQWKEDVNDMYPGKGKALFQVNTYLTWLQEAESEDDDDEE